MIPLPQKLIDALNRLDQRKATLIEGWMLGQDLPEKQWQLTPDNSAIVAKDEPPCESSFS